MSIVFTSKIRAVSGLECSGDCTTEHRLQNLRQFFEEITPDEDVPAPITLRDIGLLAAQRTAELKRVVNGMSSTRRGRQYYAMADNSGYYGTTGNPSAGGSGGVYGAASTTTSTTFNGLDAGLSALAFLAFGVWLFNLLLPQLKSTMGLVGLPGLQQRRRNAADVDYTSSGGISSLQESSPGILSNLLSNGQDLVSTIFSGVVSSRQGKGLLRSEWGSEDEEHTAKGVIMTLLEKIITPMFEAGGGTGVELLTKGVTEENEERLDRQQQGGNRQPQ